MGHKQHKLYQKGSFDVSHTVNTLTYLTTEFGQWLVSSDFTSDFLPNTFQSIHHQNNQIPRKQSKNKNNQTPQKYMTSPEVSTPRKYTLKLKARIRNVSPQKSKDT
jgi:hypothetical protein